VDVGRVLAGMPGVYALAGDTDGVDGSFSIIRGKLLIQTM